MKKTLTSLALLATLMVFGCSHIGTNFDPNLAKKIENGKTTQSEIEKMFGQPFKKGLQNGRTMWTYEYDEYQALGEKASKDLTIVFDESGKVKSHQIMSSRPMP